MLNNIILNLTPVVEIILIIKIIKVIKKILEKWI